MSDEFTTNENGSKTPEETNFQDYTAPENEIVQNETSQMTQEQPETSYGATSAEEIRSRTIRHMRMDRLRTSRHIRVNSHSRMHISRHITDRHRQREQEPDLELPHWFLEFYLFLHLHAASIIFWQCLRLFSVLCRW